MASVPMDVWPLILQHESINSNRTLLSKLLCTSKSLAATVKVLCPSRGSRVPADEQKALADKLKSTLQITKKYSRFKIIHSTRLLASSLHVTSSTVAATLTLPAKYRQTEWAQAKGGLLRLCIPTHYIERAQSALAALHMLEVQLVDAACGLCPSDDGNFEFIGEATEEQHKIFWQHVRLEEVQSCQPLHGGSVAMLNARINTAIWWLGTVREHEAEQKRQDHLHYQSLRAAAKKGKVPAVLT